MRGGLPRAFLAGDASDSFQWREGFVRTFLERDLASLGFGMSPVMMRRFWSMIAHYNAQTWKVTKSMRQAILDLELDMLWVVYPGSREIQLDDKILAKPLSRIVPTDEAD